MPLLEMMWLLFKTTLTLKAFWPEGGWWSLTLSALVSVYKTLTLAALFLIGLALRNLFKFK